MSNHFINLINDFLVDGLKNYLGEILLALTLFTIVLCRKLWWKLRDKQKLKEGSLIWSPGKKKLCIILITNGKWELNIYDVNSGKKIMLDISIAKGQTPTWSPDGTKIALVSDQDGNNEIYVVNADGSDLRRITDDPAEDICPQWSADGTKLTYFTRKNGFFVIKTVDIAEAD